MSLGPKIAPVQKLQSLQDLRQFKQTLAERRAARARAEAERIQAERQTRAEQTLFARSVGPVQALRSPARVAHQRPAPEPQARQRQRDEAQVLHEAMSDEFDVSTLLQTDEDLSFARPGLGPDVPVKLRRGHWAVQAQIDLHGLRTEQAREALGGFLRQAQRAGLRCVRVVHGKGLGSPGRVPVLKTKVQRWLVQRAEVLAFVQARPLDGGAGALVVLLQAPER